MVWRPVIRGDRNKYYIPGVRLFIYKQTYTRNGLLQLRHVRFQDRVHILGTHKAGLNIGLVGLIEALA